MQLLFFTTNQDDKDCDDGDETSDENDCDESASESEDDQLECQGLLQLNHFYSKHGKDKVSKEKVACNNLLVSSATCFSNVPPFDTTAEYTSETQQGSWKNATSRAKSLHFVPSTPKDFAINHLCYHAAKGNEQLPTKNPLVRSASMETSVSKAYDGGCAKCKDNTPAVNRARRDLAREVANDAEARGRSTSHKKSHLKVPLSTSLVLHDPDSLHIRIGSFTLERVHSEPNIYVIDDFLNKGDIAHLLNKIQNGTFERSFIDDSNDSDRRRRCCQSVDGSRDTSNSASQPATRRNFQRMSSRFDFQHRTSTFLSFSKQQDARIAAIEQRAASLLGCWTSTAIEPLQLVRYLPNQFFGVHQEKNDWNLDQPLKLLYRAGCLNRT